jgi:dienelactone hydrolase
MPHVLRFRSTFVLTALLALMFSGMLTGCNVIEQRSNEPGHINPVYYRHGATSLEGYIAYPKDAYFSKKKYPAVLVIHEWWGLNDYAKRRADQLADLGYIALAADMFGGGRNSDNVEDAKAWSSALYGTPLMAQRAQAALDVLRKDPRVDADRIIVIGYCFGGTAAVELAYSGAPVKGAVSFHGNPVPPTDEQAAALKARLLILIGAMDPMFDTAATKKLTDGLNKTNADFEIISYSGSVHSFTSPQADTRNMEGVAYNKNADERSWKQLQVFMKQVFEQK